jgi:hypothetical protein
MTTVLDVAPTILEMAGVKWDDATGTSLLALPESPARPLALGSLLFGEEWTGVRTAELKYMRSAHGEERLYDLSRDSAERVNQVAGSSDALARVRSGLRVPSGSALGACADH